jgi:hypothetical protein
MFIFTQTSAFAEYYEATFLVAIPTMVGLPRTLKVALKITMLQNARHNEHIVVELPSRFIYKRDQLLCQNPPCRNIRRFDFKILDIQRLDFRYIDLRRINFR